MTQSVHGPGRPMIHQIISSGLRWLGGTPCFRVWGKARPEKTWRVVDVYATHRRDLDSSWPAFLWRGTCITWTTAVIAVGWDFAEQVLREQRDEPASRDSPVEVIGGRLRDPARRATAGGPAFARASEVLAHECGHTWQARWLSLGYWIVGAAMTLFREGAHWWNHFENQASEQGQFGGLVNGSVCPELLRRFDPSPTTPGIRPAPAG
jgi:hypothetical protein